MNAINKYTLSFTIKKKIDALSQKLCYKLITTLCYFHNDQLNHNIKKAKLLRLVF